MYKQRCRHRHNGDKEAEVNFAGKPGAPFDRSSQIEHHDYAQRQDQQRVQGLSQKLHIRADHVEAIVEESPRHQDDHKHPQAQHNGKERAAVYVFSAGVQQVSCQHDQRKRHKQGRHKQGKPVDKPGDTVIQEGYFDDGGIAAQHQNTEEAQEEALAPGVDAGHDKGKPQSQR